MNSGQTMTTHVDLVVVGAGFAGLSCARAAALRGISTVVLDRKTDPGSRLHTTGLLVKEVADSLDVPRRLTRKIHGVRLYSPNLKYIELLSPGYYFLATDTPAVLQWMARRAEAAGAELRWGAPFCQAERRCRHLWLQEQDLVCQFLVGCDGARSAVARHFGLGLNTQFLAGVEAEFIDVRDVGEDRLHVFLDSEVAPGYIAWVVPGVRITQVGLAARKPLTLGLDRFIDKVSRLFNFERAKIVGWRGGLVPCGGTVRPMSSNNILLLSDAAGMVSPLTAGGIHPSLEVGRRAGAAISNYLLDGGPDPAEAIRGAVPSYFIKGMMRTIFDLRPPNQLFNLLLGSEIFRKTAQTIFFHHRGLLSVKAWRDLLSLAAQHDSPSIF